MQPIPCRNLEQEALDIAEMEYHRHREGIFRAVVISAMLLLLSLGHVFYAFRYYPAHKAEDFDILDREKKSIEEGGEDDPDTPNLTMPVQASQPLAGVVFAIILLGDAAMLYFAFRRPVPGVQHSPGPVEESARPGYGARTGTLANPWVVKMFYIRCRHCGRTLKEWELRQRTTPVPRKGK